MTTKPEQFDIDPGSVTVLRVENLYKKFCRTLKHSMYYGLIDSVRSMLGIAYDTDHLRTKEFWALEDIGFELRKGEALGIIGANGSGKSTLLRLITGIFPPDQGRIAFKGRIGALIAVGAGFHPYMTGRENIYLNGTILGMTRREIDEKLDTIIEFADIGDFLEAPISTYSSGMRVRLGFAIAVHCEPDILLVDEVLSVGDLAFRNKSMRKMKEYRERANALVFISHNLDQIRVLCDRVIIMDHGRILFDGPTREGIIIYENMGKDKRVATINSDAEKDLLFRQKKSDGNRAGFIDLGLLNRDGERVLEVGIHEELRVFLDFVINEECEEIYFTLAVLNEAKNTECLWSKSNDSDRYCFKNIKPGKYRVVLTYKNHHLGPGVYFINYHILNGITGESYEHGLTNISFSVKSTEHFERGCVLSEDTWELQAGR
jgi:lipopolysaccharide transport system ATP-binding protein